MQATGYIGLIFSMQNRSLQVMVYPWFSSHLLSFNTNSGWIFSGAPSQLRDHATCV